MRPPKIFISATSGDLRSIRQIVKEALLTINCHPVEQTNFEPDARTVENMLRGKIGDCQALIHICGLRYGAEPDVATLPPGTPRRSYTQMEYHIGRQLQEERGDDHFRVYTFICPEDFPFDAEPDAEPQEKRALQLAHRTRLFDDPHLREKPRDAIDLKLRILALQEQAFSLKQAQAEVIKNRHLGLKAFAVLLLLLGCIYGGMHFLQRGQRQQVLDQKETATQQAEADTQLASQMSEVQTALYRLQQQSDPAKGPISQWPQERLEAALAQQLNLKTGDLGALLAAGKTSLDALVSGQALLASGKADEAIEKIDSIIANEQSAQRLRKAYEFKAQIAFDQAKYAQALDYRQKAVALVDKIADPIAWAEAQGKVALMLFKLARYAEAEPIMREIASVLERKLGSMHPEVATALNNLAQLLQATNRLEEAEYLYRRALVIDKTNYGADHANVARDLNNLATLLQATNRLAEAESLMRRALEIDESNLGRVHPNVARSLNNLASLLQETNQWSEAEPLIRRALVIDEANYGPDHPTVARDLNNLAQLLRISGRLEESEWLFRRALAIDERALGTASGRVAVTTTNLALLLTELGQLEEGEVLALNAAKVVTLNKLRKTESLSNSEFDKVRGVYEHILELRGKSRNEISAKLTELDAWAEAEVKKGGDK